MSALPVVRNTVSCPTGTIIAPPSPCRARNTTSSARSPLTAQRTDAPANNTTAASMTRRLPKRWVSQPLSGTNTATDSRYDVTAIPMDDADACRLRAMAGAAVAIIVASRFSMNSAAATSNATGRRNPAREACGSLPSTTHPASLSRRETTTVWPVGFACYRPPRLIVLLDARGGSGDSLSQPRDAPWNLGNRAAADRRRGSHRSRRDRRPARRAHHQRPRRHLQQRHGGRILHPG